MDTRAKDLCREYEARIGADAIFRVSGNPFSPSYTLPKILYFMCFSGQARTTGRISGT